MKLLLKLCKLLKPLFLPCATSYQSLPVVTPTVNIDVPHYAVAALAGEPILAVAFLGRAFVSFHREIIM